MASGASVTASFIASLRPEQWSKNAFVFAGLLFGGRLTDGPQYLGAAVAAFAIFCGLSGAVYLINDVADRGADAAHPLKSGRPIAAGDLTPSVALAGSAGLALACLAGAFAVSRQLALAGAAYLILLTLYSVWLKHVVILDVLAIALGFVLRAVAGAVAVTCLDQPVAAHLRNAAGALPRAQQAPSRAGAAWLRRGGTPSDSRRLQPLPARSDDLGGGGGDAGRLQRLHHQLRYRRQGRLEQPGPHDPLRVLRNIPVSLPAPQGARRGKPGSDALTDGPLLACVGLWGLSVGLLLYL